MSEPVQNQADKQDRPMHGKADYMTTDWEPVPGATVTEQGDGYAVNYPALYECPRCAAAVPRGQLEKHDAWHVLFGDRS